MGGAADFPQRSSSPLKRPASDLEDPSSGHNEDIDMDAVTPSGDVQDNSNLGEATLNTQNSPASILDVSGPDGTQDVGASGGKVPPDRMSIAVFLLL